MPILLRLSEVWVMHYELVLSQQCRLLLTLRTAWPDSVLHLSHSRLLFALNSSKNSSVLGCMVWSE